MDYTYRGYRFSKDQSLFRVEDVKRLLDQSHWAKDRPLETIRKSMEHSLCFGAFSPAGELVGFARMITDYAVTYYVSDVIVDEAHRNYSIGTHLVKFLLESEEAQGLNGVLLTTYAHRFYETLGFVRNSKKCMVHPAGAEMHLEEDKL